MDSTNNEIDKIVLAWEKASLDLNIEIETPFYLDTGKEKVKYKLLIKQFGSKLGTLILSTDDMTENDLTGKIGYYSSALNPYHYGKYNRKKFIDTLTDWGFFGQLENKPTWYKGHIY